MARVVLRSARAPPYRRSMDWTAAGVIVSGALGAAALAVSLWDRKVNARNAADADRRADRAQATADEAAAAAKRAADATERMAQAAQEQALAAARVSPEPQAAWTLERWPGDTFALTNVGNADALDVHVDTGDLRAVPMDAGGLDRERVEPGEVVRFAAGVTFGTKDDTVTVTWADEPGGTEPRSWKRPLPPKAPPQTPLPRPPGLGTQRGLPGRRP